MTRRSAARMTLRACTVWLQAFYPHPCSHAWGHTGSKRPYNVIYLYIHSGGTPKGVLYTCILRSLHVAQSQQVALRNRDVSQGALAMLHTALASIVPRPLSPGGHCRTIAPHTHTRGSPFLSLTQAQGTSPGRHGNNVSPTLCGSHPPAAQHHGIAHLNAHALTRR